MDIKELGCTLGTTNSNSVTATADGYLVSYPPSALFLSSLSCTCNYDGKWIVSAGCEVAPEELGVFMEAKGIEGKAPQYWPDYVDLRVTKLADVEFDWAGIYEM